MRFGAAVCLFLLAASLNPLYGQQPADPLEPLRTKESFTDADRQTLRTWISQRISEMSAADAAAAQHAVSGFRAALAKGTDGFKEAFTTAAIEAILPAYKSAEPAAAARLIAALAVLQRADARRVFVEALKDERAAVRAAAAGGLHSTRESIARTGPDGVAPVLNALRDAGKAETSRDTLRAIYRALDYTSLPANPDPRANAAALLDLLSTRAAQYAANEVKAEGADMLGLRLAAALRTNYSEDDRKKLAAAAAHMLRYGVVRYTSGTRPLISATERTSAPHVIDLRNQTEQLITEAEALLVQLLSPAKAPTVADKMREAEPTDMKIQMNNWAVELQKAINQDFRLDANPDAAPGG